MAGLLVSLNFALSADGKAATREPGPSGFASSADHQRLLDLRAPADALLVGHATLRADSMSMNLASRPDLAAARETRRKPPHPARIVLTRHPDSADLADLAAKPGGPVHLLSPVKLPSPPAGISCHRIDTTQADADPQADPLAGALTALATAKKWDHIHCEGGPTLARRLLACGLVGRLHLTITHHLFGGGTSHTLTGPGWLPPFQASSRWTTTERVIRENEIFLTLQRSN